MAKHEILITPNSHYSLQSAEPVFFEIGEGMIADVYYIERLGDGIGRRMFLFEVKGPLVFCSFPVNDLADLMLTSHGVELPINRWSLEDFALQEDTQAKTSKLNTGMGHLLSIFPDIVEPPDTLYLDESAPYVTANSVYASQTPHEIKWLSNLPKDTRFLGDLDLDRFGRMHAPITRQFHYHFKNAGEVTILTTDKLVHSQELLKQLVGLNKLLDHYFGRAYLTATAKKYQQVRSGYYFRRNAVEDSLGHLGKIVSKNAQNEDLKVVKTLHAGEDVKTASLMKEKGLLEICQIIGKYEKITFREGFKSVNKFESPLKNILRASNIRARRVHLANNWWENNHGAMLGYMKDTNVPVALIPKRNSAYILHDLKNKQKMYVDADVASLLSDEAYSFFTPLPKGSPKPMDLLKFALQFTAGDVTMFLVIGVIGALLALLIPIASGYIFDKVIPGGKTAELLNLGFLLLFAVIVIGLMNFTKALAVLRFEGKSSYKLQSALWDRILSLKVPFFSQYNPGDLAERSLGIEKIRTTLSASVMGAISSGIFSVFYLALMFFYDVRLALLALVLGTAVAVFTLIISMLAYDHVANFRRMEAIISGFMMMAIRGICKIRLTDSKEKVFGIWAEKFALQKEHYAKKQSLLIVASIFTVTFPILASLLIYIRIDHLLVDAHNGFQIGDFIAFNTAYLAFQGALIQTFMVTVPILSIKPTYELFKPILQADMEDFDDKTDPGQLNGSIEISGLHFKYKDSPDWILKDINLKIKPGEFVALVGSSGSGKSTLYRILLGFEHYQEGSVLFDQHEMRNVDIRVIRDQLGVVLQNGKIMQGTVLYNIIGNANYTEEDAWEAARKAGMDKDINELPLKMHTILPPGGGTMSGGQQQRLVIARALVRKPKILMFDEATSALDNEIQKVVSDNIEKLRATRIVIAHRLSTIMNADRIIVMDKGRIVEEGTFKELTEKEGFFHKLVKSQII